MYIDYSNYIWLGLVKSADLNLILMMLVCWHETVFTPTISVIYWGLAQKLTCVFFGKNHIIVCAIRYFFSDMSLLEIVKVEKRLF